MNNNICRFLLLIILLNSALSFQAKAESRKETIKIATYNIENFMKCFDQEQLPERSREKTELFRDYEDIHEVKSVISAIDPDILVIQECCNQEMLDRFNARWLNGKFAYVKVFLGNRPGQWLAMMAKPGYKAHDVRMFWQVKDKINDPKVRGTKQHEGLERENLLFPRGPAFVLFSTPAGTKIWIGVTHVKSKYNNSQAVTEWRIREIETTRQICANLLNENLTEYLLIAGDFNDDFGMDYHERKIGKDAVAMMLTGQKAEKLLSPTKQLYERDNSLATYHCRLKPPKYRSFIDHVFVSQALQGNVTAVKVVDMHVAEVASDHLPVLTEIKLPIKE